MSEPIEHARKRLAMRSMRRGIKEMDLILTSYSDAHIETMSAEELAHYDLLLAENDQELYTWITGQKEPPEEFAQIIGRIAGHFRA